MIDFSNVKCRYLTKNEIWLKADDLIRTHWDFGVVPVDVEYIVEAKVGLEIIPLPGLTESCSVDAYLKSDFTGIVIDNTKYNDERYDNRLRFSIAHELGHYILHGYLYQDNGINIENPKEYYDFITHFPDKEYRSFEYQANQFAGRLLVPRQKLIEEVLNISNTLEENNLTHLLTDDPDFILERTTPRLCKPFGVSEDVIKRRVEEENLWPPDTI